MPELKIVNYRQATTRAVGRELGEEKEAIKEELVALILM